MKNFLAVYLGTAAAMSQWNELADSVRAQRQAAAVQAWHDWADRHKDRIVDGGGPLGKTKHVSKAGMADVRNSMMAYTIIRAASHDEAAALFQGHPHFTLFPGDSVEIMECLPIPGR